VLYYEGGRDRLNVQLPILFLAYLEAGDDNALIFWRLGDLGLMLLLQPERWKVTLDVLVDPYHAVDYCIGWWAPATHVLQLVWKAIAANNGAGMGGATPLDMRCEATQVA
jgi:hypothetical protein